MSCVQQALSDVMSRMEEHQADSWTLGRPSIMPWTLELQQGAPDRGIVRACDYIFTLSGRLDALTEVPVEDEEANAPEEKGDETSGEESDNGEEGIAAVKKLEINGKIFCLNEFAVRASLFDSSLPT
jgi:hypothetical protein